MTYLLIFKGSNTVPHPVFFPNLVPSNYLELSWKLEIVNQQQLGVFLASIRVRGENYLIGWMVVSGG
jgi:hypothetical protein